MVAKVSGNFVKRKISTNNISKYFKILQKEIFSNTLKERACNDLDRNRVPSLPQNPENNGIRELLTRSEGSPNKSYPIHRNLQ
jgi:hypothetical protein